MIGKQYNTNPNSLKNLTHRFPKGNKPWNANKNVSKECVVCFKGFRVPLVRNKTAKFCSKSCAANYRMIGNKYRLGTKQPPRWIDKLKIWSIFYTDKNPKWKGGIYKLKRYNHTKNAKYIQWRKRIFKRDDFTCRKCGKRGCELHSHHIKQYANFPELRYDDNNGIALCVPCHRHLHFGQ